MKTSTLERWAPLTGVLAIALMIVGSVIGGVNSFRPEPAALAARIAAEREQIILGLNLQLYAVFFLMWFGVSLWSRINGEDGSGKLAGGAVLGGFVGASLALAVNLQAKSAAIGRGSFSLESLALMFDFAAILLGEIVPGMLAVSIIGVGIAAIRTPLLPGWFGWASVVVGVGLISPISYVFLVFALLWIVVVSIWLVVKRA